jgi:hypothetical protein
MRFNIEHYRKYYKVAGRNEKDGIWDVLRFPNGKYCFATNQRLGDNGSINSHPLLGKKFKGTHSDEIYTMDSVCIHWHEGYYYHATLVDENSSHTTAIIENINSNVDWVLSGVESFNTKYELL